MPDNKSKILYLIFSIAVISSLSGFWLYWSFNYRQPIGTNRYINQAVFGNYVTEAIGYSPDSFLPATVDKSLNMLFFGDLMLDRHVGETIEKNGLDSLLENFNATTSPIDLNSYDLVGANLEGAVTDGGAHYPPVNSYDFAFAPELIGSLKNYNFSYFNLANNHLADQGERGIMETRRNLASRGFLFAGCGDRNTGDCSATTTVINGKIVGFIGFSMVYGLLDANEIINIVSRLDQAADLLIVNIHWGVEYEHRFNSIQRQVAHDMVDAGADLVIGHHPHVVQGMEIYKGKAIIYSLGNFIFDQYFSPDTQEGLALGIEWQAEGEVLDLFPFRSRASQVVFMNEDEGHDFYEKFIGWSNMDENTAEQIRSGKIELN